MDIEDPTLYRFTPGTGETTSVPLTAQVGAVALRERGGLICAAKGGVGKLDPITGRVDLFA